MMALVHQAKDKNGEMVIRTDMDAVYDAKMNKLVVSYKDTMPPGGAPHYPDARDVEHAIDEYPGSTPVSQRGYRMSEEELACLRQHLKELLEKGFIRPSCSPYGAPVLFVPKKEKGQFRMCIDWRMLNKQTIKNKYPLPRIDDLLERLHGSKYWSKLDLAQGYYQVRIREQDIHKTAFQTRYGLYEFTVLGMGLCNAPATFMRVMNDALRPYLDKFVLVYLDDILIFSETQEEHLEHVRLVLETLRKEKLYAAPSKCEFGRTTIKFLGHTLTPHGITPEDTKMDLIKNWPKPTTVSDLRSFLGLANYYRTFVKHFAHKAAPLNELVKKGSTCTWGSKEQQAFDALKEALTSHPIIRPPNPKAPFNVHTDASDIAIGATLMQHDEVTGKEYVVAYDSRKLSDTEKKWAAHEREQLAVVHALTTWRHHLHGRKFLLITDSACVKSLPTQPNLTQRQSRWVTKLADFDFDIQHRAGPQNVVPDALSRHPCHRQDNLSSMTTVHTSEIQAQSLRDEIQMAAINDSRYQRILQDIRRGVQTNFHLHEGLLLLQGTRLYIPKSEPLITRLISEAHDTPISGHLGSQKTLARLVPHFYWPGMHGQVKRYCRTCLSCQQIKPSRQKPMGLTVPHDVPPDRFHTWSLDFVVDLPQTRRRHNAILTIQCSFTKYLRVLPCNINITAQATAKLVFDNLGSIFGLPRRLISDRDPRFTSAFWKKYCEILGTRLNMSTADHPQTDGQSEKANDTVKTMLRAFVYKRPTAWDESLPAVEHAYNTTVHATTGYTPYFLTFGKDPYTPLQLAREATIPSLSVPAVQEDMERLKEAIDEVRDALEAAKQVSAAHNDKTRRDGALDVGTHVYIALSRGRKTFDPKYDGPYEILEKTSPVTYKLKLPEGDRRHPIFHICKLQPYHDGHQEFPSRAEYTSHIPVTHPAEAHTVPYVEVITDHRTVTTSTGSQSVEVLVRYSNDPATVWKPLSDLQRDYPELVRAYFHPDSETVPTAPDNANNDDNDDNEEPNASGPPNMDMLRRFGGEDFQDETGTWQERAPAAHHLRPQGTRASARIHNHS